VSKIAVKDFRDGIVGLEEKMKLIPGSTGPEAYPLKHNFAEGLYIRKINVPKGHLVVTKIHKKSHPFFMLKGEASILTEDGVVRLKAPFYDITKAGTKRVIYMHEDVEWVTVHATGEIDLEEIETDLIAKSFNSFDQYLDEREAKKLLALMEEN
jgi:hypothetical protein